MPEIVKCCPLCGSQLSRFFDRREFRGHEVVNRICGNCGLVYQSPRMIAAELDDFYAREYRQVYQGEAGPTPKDLFVQSGRADALLRLVGDSINEVNRHLDIGCSAGVLLARFRERYHCDVAGVEPGAAYRSYAQAQGLSVYPDLADMQAAGGACFDLVSMAHVLEHIPAPVEYLADLRADILTPDGWLLIEVPNLYCHDSFEIAHTTSFSGHTLRQTIEKAGLEVVKLKKHGLPRSELLPLYLTVLARPRRVAFEVDLQREHSVALKRRIGMFWRRVVQKLFPRRAWIPLKKMENRDTR
ncbi:MAG: methyltransferase domain-containing protein [Chloroflexi bacterium]|nr:methyltransferase domain-containing protein [Chloroflexota bacterium]MBU1660068.1 methyltransferase domain-containing protein [Chloroflexota bacterium]